MSIIPPRTQLVQLSISNVPGSGSGPLSDASQAATNSDVSSLTSAESGLRSVVEGDSDSASDTKTVCPKSARGVWGLANVFADGNVFHTHVPEANCLPQGLEPPAKPPPPRVSNESRVQRTLPFAPYLRTKLFVGRGGGGTPKAAKPCAKPWATSAPKLAAQVAAQPAAKPYHLSGGAPDVVQPPPPLFRCSLLVGMQCT